MFEFKNLTVDETVEDLNWALDYIRDINPQCRFIITVSPVPLNATAENRHVLVSTVYSKSVLRIAAEQICQAFPVTDYFPSYEIITSPHAGGLYFAADKRTVTEAGVDHVMNVFLRHYGVAGEETRAPAVDKRMAEQQQHLAEMKNVVKVLCDEEAIDNS
ncbi:MAG: GSCFA domain-containing protein [Asticcacaulis sp.]